MSAAPAATSSFSCPAPSLAAQTMFLDVSVTLSAAGRLAQALDGAQSLEEANDALNALGVRTELDLERRPPEPTR